MASGLQAADTEYILTVPCDAPFVPANLAAGLYRALARQAADLSIAHDGNRLQPIFSLLRRTLLPALDDYLAGGGRRVHEWVAGQSAAQADFSAQPGAFTNLNTPADFDRSGTGSGREMRAQCRTT
jgi:molybdopterin-guanine dinucleotide biosynthesis protein A